jgi:hypothetical protein
MDDTNVATEQAAKNVDAYVIQAIRIIGQHETDGKRCPSVDSLVVAITIECGVKRLLEALKFQ